MKGVWYILLLFFSFLNDFVFRWYPSGDYQLTTAAGKQYIILLLLCELIYGENFVCELWCHEYFWQ